MKYTFTEGLAKEGMDKVLIKPEEVSSREEPCFALLAFLKCIAVVNCLSLKHPQLMMALYI